MKNLFKSMMLVAVAAMGFTACSKDATEEVAPETKGATEVITISTDITRTTLNADRTQLTWVAGDQFAVYTDQGTKNTPVTYTDGAENFDLEVAAGSQTVYAYYPYYDRQSTQYDQTSVSMYVTSTQNQKEAGVFDGNTNDYVMVAKGAIDADKHVGLTFKPVACALAFNIYGGQTGETVQEVTFNPGVVCAGQHYMDITVDNPVYTAANGAATSVTVTLENPFEAVGEKPADPKAFTNQVYAVVARKAYEGATMTVKTSLNTYTFKTASTLDLTTDFFTMNLNLAKGETPAPPAEDEAFVKISSMDDLTDGDYVITGVYNGTYYALPVPSASSAKISGAEITVTDDQIASKDAVGKVWTIEKTGEYYSLYSGSVYLYHSNGGGSGTDLASGSAQTYPWSITYTSNVFRFAGVNNSAIKTRGMLFNTGTKQFGGYALSNLTNSGYCGLTLFKKIKTDPNEKKFTIDNFNATLNSEKTEISFTGTYTNTYEVEPQWSLTVSKDGNEIGSITVSGENGQIVADNYSVEEDGSYTFTLTASINGETKVETAEIVRNTASNDLLWITKVEDISAGQYYIATPDGHLYNGAIKSGHLQVTTNSATITSGIVTNIPDGAVLVTFTATGTANQYQLKDANDKYINVTKAGSGGFSLGASLSTSWTFSNIGNGLLAIGSNYTAHFRAYNNSSFRSYADNNGAEIYLVKVN